MDIHPAPPQPNDAVGLPRRRQALLALVAAMLIVAALLVRQPPAHAASPPKISFTFECGGSTGDYGFSAVNTDLQAHTLVEHVEVKPSGSFDETVPLAVGQPSTFNSTNSLAGDQVRITVTEGGVVLAKSEWMTQDSALSGCWKAPIAFPSSSTTTVVPSGLPKVTISVECDEGAAGVRWDAVNVDLKKHYLHTIVHSGLQLYSNTVLMGTNAPSAFSSYGAYDGEHIQMAVEEAGVVLASSPTYIIDTSQPDCLQKKDGPGPSTTTSTSTTVPGGPSSSTTSTTVLSTNTTTTSTTRPRSTSSTTTTTNPTTTSTTEPSTSTTTSTSTTEPGTTTTEGSTVPHGTVPPGTVPPGTVPHDTVPPTVVTTTEPSTSTSTTAATTTEPEGDTRPVASTTDPAGPPATAVATSDPVDPPFVSGTETTHPGPRSEGPLARTGAALAPLVVAGSLLLLAGLALVDARRRLDQRRR